MSLLDDWQTLVLLLFGLVIVGAVVFLKLK